MKTDVSIFDPPADLAAEDVAAFERTWRTPTGLLGMLRTVNNIPIAQRYMTAGFIFFLIGGALALLMRIQLGTPDNTFLDADTYNQLFTMHGTTMMFLFVIPFIEAIANYMLPLLLGTRDMPFPRLTAFSFWTYVFGGIFLYSSFLFGAAPNGGWFAYVPLNNVEFSPGINMDFWDIGLSVAEVAAMGAAAELIVAILRMRAPGMTLSRMPLFCWAMLVTAVMIIFAFTPLIVGTAMLETDRKGLTAFFKPAAGGEPLLWQHLFWIFGHPEVYIMFLPAVGIVSHIVQTFSRRPIVGYPFMVAAILSTGFLSFGLWVHHMFAAGVSAAATSFFTATSMVIAIPAGVQVFSWIATLWLGRPVWRTPLLFVAGFLVIFTLGGLTGVMLAAVPFDLQTHDTFFVVAHFHYVLIGGVVFPLFAGLYYWLPKITGRVFNEKLGRWNFWLMFLFFNVTFFPMHISGLLGMPRRVYTYAPELGVDTYNLVSTIGAFGFAGSALLLVVNFFYSRKYGEAAGDNPFQSDTLEWSQTSPPAQAQFQMLPSVRSRHPLWEQADLEHEDPVMARTLHQQFDYRPADWRGALIVSVKDGTPKGIVHIPTDTIVPFAMAVAFLLLFAAALIDNVVLFSLGAVTALATLVLWFRPQATEERALAAYQHHDSQDRLPLVTVGPESNGFWGTLVLAAVLATALVTLVVSFFYIGEAPGLPAPRGTWSRPLLVVLAGLSLAAIHTVLVRRIRRPQARASVFLLAVSLLIAAAEGGLLFRVFLQTGVVARASAHGSAVAALVVFQALMLILLIAFTLVAMLWALGAPDDARGKAVIWNVSVIAWLAAFSALVVAFCMVGMPLLW